ncbi:hypothetical protein FE246_00235 [Aliarcobacter thereius]|uniref:Uncharacterized protein n=1 Tax=Aliarcobacter thereius TaxID=544718 RepID=A0A5R9H3Z3_9BACT|nr:hypothetical protein [Aliarcobacter thereius]TLS72949.1 hypothetical protein FE246_00235 [Aliarcobacter thereius]
MQTTINQGNNSRVAVRDYYENCNFTINKLQELNNLLEFQKVKQKEIINKFEKPIPIKINFKPSKKIIIFFMLTIFISLISFFYTITYLTFISFFCSLLVFIYALLVKKNLKIVENKLIFSEYSIIFKYKKYIEIYLKDIADFKKEDEINKNNEIIGVWFLIYSKKEAYPMVVFSSKDYHHINHLTDLLNILLKK